MRELGLARKVEKARVRELVEKGLQGSPVRMIKEEWAARQFRRKSVKEESRENLMLNGGKREGGRE